MNIKIRPFEEDADYDRLEETEKLIYPDEWDSAEYYRLEDKQHAKHANGRWLAFDGERPIGNAEYLAAHWWDDPNQYVFYLGVIPEYWGQGIGKQLLATLMETLDGHGARAIITWMREDHDRAKRFLEDRGFSMIQRDAQSELLLAEFDPSPFAGTAARLKQHGITLRTLADLQENDVDWLQKLYDLDWPILLDIPSTEPRKRTPLEEWKTRKLDSPYVLHDGYIVAVAEDGQYVGYSSINKSSSDATKLMTQVTGMLREWRRKGIATGMKLAVIDYAKRNGYEKIVTENEENNPMYALNVALGFRPIPAWLTYKKVLQ